MLSVQFPESVRISVICTTIHQILLDSRKIFHRSRGRLRSIKIFVLVAAGRAVFISGRLLPLRVPAIRAIACDVPISRFFLIRVHPR